MAPIFLDLSDHLHDVPLPDAVDERQVQNGALDSRPVALTKVRTV